VSEAAGAATLSRTTAARPLLMVLAIAALVFLAVLALRAAGAFERLELLAYDHYLGWRTTMAAARGESDVVIVAITDADLEGADVTVADDRLAAALAAVMAERPRAVGLDLLRAGPIPPGTADLERVLRAHPEIVVTAGYADRHEPTRPSRSAPPAVTDPTRIGFADMDLDPDGVLRRGLLYLTGGAGPGTALALRLAMRFLAPAGIVPAGDGIDMRLGATTYVPLSPRDGGYATLQPGGYQFLLTLPQCRGGVPTVPLGAALDGGLASHDLAGKVVLLGNQASDAKDVFKIPLACAGGIDEQLYGVALHGQIVSQLIAQARGTARPLQSLAQVLRDPARGRVAEGAWIVLWTAAGGIAALRLRRPLLVGLAGLLGTLGLVALTLWAFVAAGWWLPVVPPLIGLLLTLGLVTGFVLARESLKRARLMRMFAAYMSPQIATALWREDDERETAVAPVELTATVLFSDIRGFTTISERLAEKPLLAWLNEYMAEMADLVLAHGGVIEKFAGDGLTAEFGVPEPRSTEAGIAADAQAAVDCALAMSRAMEHLNRRWQARGLPKVGIRVGIHTGPLIVGNLGSAQRMQYSIIGDTANTAARLESYGKDDPRLGSDTDHCRILISEATLQHLSVTEGRAYRVMPVGGLALKGKAQPVAVHRVLPGTKEEDGND
jgi:adenylate cyclase